MKTVTIPSDYNPFEVQVAGVRYSYRAGETVSVPDEVASVIENRLWLEKKPDAPGKAGQVWTTNGTGEASWQDIPYPAPYVLPAASATALGGVKKGSAVADATEETAVDTVNALIASLVAAGVIAAYVPPAPPAGE